MAIHLPVNILHLDMILCLAIGMLLMLLMVVVMMLLHQYTLAV